MWAFYFKERKITGVTNHWSGQRSDLEIRSAYYALGSNKLLYPLLLSPLFLCIAVVKDSNLKINHNYNIVISPRLLLSDTYSHFSNKGRERVYIILCYFVNVSLRSKSMHLKQNAKTAEVNGIFAIDSDTRIVPFMRLLNLFYGLHHVPESSICIVTQNYTLAF